jgi:hypothetical protein
MKRLDQPLDVPGLLAQQIEDLQVENSGIRPLPGYKGILAVD